MKNNDFNFFVGIDVDEDILKSSAKKKGSKRYDNMLIYGLASDNSKDKQGETLEPSGYDIDEFLQAGLLNLEHYTTRKGDPSYWIGEPLDAHVKGDEFFIKGKLWKSHPLARNFWDTMLIMRESGSKRKPGFSIEGKKLESDPNNKKRITKAKIKHCACTFSPVNGNSWMDIAKGEQKVDYVDAFSQKEIKGGTEYILQFEKDGNIVTVNKDYSVSIKPKSMTTDTTRSLIKESLEKKEYKLNDWDNIMKAIKSGRIKREHIPVILKKINENFIVG